MTWGKPLHILCSGPLGDKSLISWYNSFTQKMVLKWPFVSNTGNDCMFIAQFSQETELWVKKDSFTLKMVLKRLFISDSGDDSAVHIHWSGLQETASNWYDSFIGKMVLRRPFVGDSRKPWLSTFIVQVSRRQSFKPFSQGTGFLVNTIVLVAGSPWKDHLSVTMGSLCLLVQVFQRKSFESVW